MQHVATFYRSPCRTKSANNTRRYVWS